MSDQLKTIKVRIFIASSQHAQTDAQTLSYKIKQQKGRYSITTTLWWQLSSPLLDILDELLDAARGHDFAIVLLPSIEREQDGVAKKFNELQLPV